MNYKTNIFCVFAVCTLLLACNNREVVPAPKQNVRLDNRFYGKIDNVDVELTRNVNGYIGGVHRHTIFHSNEIDSVTYYSSFKSPSSPEAIMVGHGSIITELETDQSSPDKQTFENFYTNYANQTPKFSTNAVEGVYVEYTDKTGTVWKSNQKHSYPLENAQYQKMSIQSDPSGGDYALFTITFGTYLYSSTGDSVLLSNAHYTGWYSR